MLVELILSIVTLVVAILVIMSIVDVVKGVANKNVIFGTIGLLIIVILIWCILILSRFFYISDTVAEKGIIFKDRINLDKHIKIGDGTGILFDYDLYTRSDRSNETIIVYKK